MRVVTVRVAAVSVAMERVASATVAVAAVAVACYSDGYACVSVKHINSWGYYNTASNNV